MLIVIVVGLILFLLPIGIIWKFNFKEWIEESANDL